MIACLIIYGILLYLSVAYYLISKSSYNEIPTLIRTGSRNNLVNLSPPLNNRRKKCNYAICILWPITLPAGFIFGLLPLIALAALIAVLAVIFPFIAIFDWLFPPSKASI